MAQLQSVAVVGLTTPLNGTSKLGPVYPNTCSPLSNGTQSLRDGKKREPSTGARTVRPKDLSTMSLGHMSPPRVAPSQCEPPTSTAWVDGNEVTPLHLVTYL